jgi:hypothetical protein
MTETPRWVVVLGLGLGIVILLGLAGKLVGIDHSMGHAPSHGCHGP